MIERENCWLLQAAELPARGAKPHLNDLSYSVKTLHCGASKFVGSMGVSQQALAPKKVENESARRILNLGGTPRKLGCDSPALR